MWVLIKDAASAQALAKPEQAGIKGAFVGGLTVASLNGLFPMAWALVSSCMPCHPCTS